MKSADNEIAAGVGRVRRETDLPDLGVRIITDFGRIVAAEARLLETNLLGAAQALVDRVYLTAILVVVAAAGIVSIIGSIMMLLHQWMPWWQVLGIVGITSILLAAILRRILMPRDVSVFQISTTRESRIPLVPVEPHLASSRNTYIVHAHRHSSSIATAMSRIATRSFKGRTGIVVAEYYIKFASILICYTTH